MATTDPLPPEALAKVVAQLGEFLPSTARVERVSPLAKMKRPELAESLAVCLVTAEQVLKPPADLSRLVEPSGLWHHQIRTSEGPTHLARSSLQGFDPTDVQVDYCVRSDIAKKIDETLVWLDETLGDGEAVVRILVIPAYYVHAFAIVRGKRYAAVLVDQPASFTKIEARKQYPLRDFLKRLAKEGMSAQLG